MSAAEVDAKPAQGTIGIHLREKGRTYALVLLSLVAVFNSADRAIISILAEALKADLHLKDETIGFLYGTAFATFFTVFGLPIARLADNCRRTKLLAIGLIGWSAMTTLSGFARNFTELAAARFGVGLGEAIANPCSHSLIADYYPKKERAAALGTYLGGLALGGGLTVLVGGYLLHYWPTACGRFGACGLAPWQATFFVFGVPGMVLGLLVSRLRDPVRGAVDGTPFHEVSSSPLSSLLVDLAGVIPPLSIVRLARLGGATVALRNFGWGALIVAAATGLTALTGDAVQWIAVGIGVYALLSWCQAVGIRDPEFLSLTFRRRTFLLLLGGAAVAGGIGGGVGFWVIPHAIRDLHVDPKNAGLTYGVTMALTAFVGTVGTGWLADRWRRRSTSGQIWVTLLFFLAPIPFAFTLYLARDQAVFLIGLVGFGLTNNSWSSAIAAQVQEFVLPRMRATAAASYALSITLVIFAIGPYTAGKISTATGSLPTGALALYAAAPVAMILLILAAGAVRAERREAPPREAA
jgi:MFS family permease